MKRTEYNYAIVRYVHDVAIGEALNIGVMLFAPGQHYFEASIDERHHRLSQAFVDFDGNQYRQVVRALRGSVESMLMRVRNAAKTESDLFGESKKLNDLEAIVKVMFPDRDLSFQVSGFGVGHADNPEAELAYLFERYVTSQQAKPREERRSDEQVWHSFQRSLKRPVAAALSEKVLSTKNIELHFDHAFRNSKWHVLQPLSMDNVKAETITNKAARWLGYGVELESHTELATLYLLLGRPSIKENENSYAKAKDLLNKMPVKHQLIEEDEANDFARDLAKYMASHGVIKTPDDPTT